MERAKSRHRDPRVYTFLFPRLLRQDFAIVYYLTLLFCLSIISRDTILLPRMKILPPRNIFARWRFPNVWSLPYLLIRKVVIALWNTHWSMHAFLGIRNFYSHAVTYLYFQWFEWKLRVSYVTRISRLEVLIIRRIQKNFNVKRCEHDTLHLNFFTVV